MLAKRKRPHQKLVNLKLSKCHYTFSTFLISKTMVRIETRISHTLSVYIFHQIQKTSQLFLLRRMMQKENYNQCWRLNTQFFKLENLFNIKSFDVLKNCKSNKESRDFQILKSVANQWQKFCYYLCLFSAEWGDDIAELFSTYSDYLIFWLSNIIHHLA